MEHLLRTNPNEREQFVQKVFEGKRDDRIEHKLDGNVSITRLLRFTPSKPRCTQFVEMIYVLSGEIHMVVGDRTLTLHKGDFFLPNQYTMTSWDALGENDIAVCFVMNNSFLEDTCIHMKTNTILSEFMLDTLRHDVAWNRYLHFSDIQDLGVFNLAETLIYDAFPYLDDNNIARGSSPDKALTGDLMCALFLMLARNMDALSDGSTTNYEEFLLHTICNYIASEYKTGSLQELAGLVHMSESALSRQVKELLGFNFKDLLLQKRFERAKQLLQQTNLPIADIAQSVGYENTSFFYRRFRELYGYSPKTLRKEN